MEWAGSALGGANGAGGVRPGEYGHFWFFTFIYF